MEAPKNSLNMSDTDSIISDSLYYYCGTMEREALWNTDHSDDRSMQRRNPIRRQRNLLDDDKTKDAMKLLEKYVRKKYRSSQIFNQDNTDIEHSGTPILQPQSTCQHSRNLTPAERLSNVFNSTSLGPVIGEFHYPPISPSSHETTFLSKLKKQNQESWRLWLLRVIKFIYKYLGLQYVMLILVIIGYACLGGCIFRFLEHDQQLIDLEAEKETKHNESAMIAENLMNYVKELKCGQSNEKKCLELITKAFIERSEKVEKSIRGDGWRWDFWNSVFFSATIFTTIGYGNLACKTNIGRVATIIYGLLGIPLMLFVLKMFGELCIKLVQKIRYRMRRCAKRCIRTKLKRASTIESVASDEITEGNDGSEDEPLTDFPVKWALIIIFLFMVVCSFIVSFWEKWDFLTAFYFFFVSLSTIGFGDVIPEHPRTACGLFILYFVGLALFSMVYAILQERVENQYMWALELIDQEYQETKKLEQELEELEEKPSESGGIGETGCKDGLGKSYSQNSVRWRFKNNGHETGTMPDRPISERTYSVFTPGEGPHAPPPVLSAFMLHNLSLKRRLIAKSENILNQQALKRPSTLFPSNEMLSTPAHSTQGSPRPHAAGLNHPREPTTLGKPGTFGVSAPNLATHGGGNRSPSGALSVITEASDEDSRHFRKHRKPLAQTISTEENYLHGSAESLDQVMDELQLETHDQAITPKPNRDPIALKPRKHNETNTLKTEEVPLSQDCTPEEKDEDVHHK